MTRLVFAALLLLGSGIQANATDLILKRVMLSSGGVGYFEYSADIDGDAELGLDVPLSQIDDILKSLVVFDSQGGVAGVELPGRDGTVQAFGDAPFGPEALASPVAYLNALRGTEVTVQGPHPMTGRIVSAQPVSETIDTGTTQRVRVTLLSSDGLRQFVLEDAESKGNSERTVSVGYVVGAPLWKATYRLMLSPDPSSSARLQGWATLENQSGADWQGVTLTLQYGNPVTFRQALYRSYFVQRPEVPVEVLGRVLPDIDTRAQSAVQSAMAPAPMPMGRAMLGAAAIPAPAPAAMAVPADAVQADENAQETIFTLAQPVDLAAGHTANVPIIDRAIPVTRIGFVPFKQPHPLAA
ncbi:MAG: DUF4139 domain-containing protein, partial [Acetobacteraceae bacterium]